MICRLTLIHSEIILQPYALHLFHLQDHFTHVLQTGCARFEVLVVERRPYIPVASRSWH
jgi:hypothetical protein